MGHCRRKGIKQQHPKTTHLFLPRSHFSPGITPKPLHPGSCCLRDLKPLPLALCFRSERKSSAVSSPSRARCSAIRLSLNASLLNVMAGLQARPPVKAKRRKNEGRPRPAKGRGNHGPPCSTDCSGACSEADISSAAATQPPGTARTSSGHTLGKAEVALISARATKKGFFGPKRRARKLQDCNSRGRNGTGPPRNSDRPNIAGDGKSRCQFTKGKSCQTSPSPTR